MLLCTQNTYKVSAPCPCMKLVSACRPMAASHHVHTGISYDIDVAPIDDHCPSNCLASPCLSTVHALMTYTSQHGVPWQCARHRNAIWSSRLSQYHRLTSLDHYRNDYFKYASTFTVHHTCTSNGYNNTDYFKNVHNWKAEYLYCGNLSKAITIIVS